LKKQIILRKTFSKVRTIGGGDVAYSKNDEFVKSKFSPPPAGGD
jgi:deoxyinosine 3'endonuclease (endonuclease V)